MEEVMGINRRFLEGINRIHRDVEFLKRDAIRTFKDMPKTKENKPSLFGSVKGRDITEEMTEESKHSLFRDLEDIG